MDIKPEIIPTFDHSMLQRIIIIVPTYYFHFSLQISLSLSLTLNFLGMRVKEKTEKFA